MRAIAANTAISKNKEYEHIKIMTCIVRSGESSTGVRLAIWGVLDAIDATKVEIDATTIKDPRKRSFLKNIEPAALTKAMNNMVSHPFDRGQ